MKKRNHMNPGPEPLPTPDELAFVEQWTELIDRAARGELDGDELDALEAAARQDPVLREELEDARAVRPLFARAGQLAAGTALDQRILGAIDAEPDSRPSRPRHRARRIPTPRPLRAIPAWGWTAVAAAAVLILVWSGPLNQFGASAPEPTGAGQIVAHDGTPFSESEVQAAAQEMELALAMLSQTMQRTSVRLQEEMNSGVREPLNNSFRQGFGRTLRDIPYLNRPDTSEEHSGINIPPRDALHRSLGVALPGERT
jgi:hypothetical protein